MSQETAAETLELVIFFKAQVVLSIDKFTFLGSAEPFKTRAGRDNQAHLSAGENLAGTEAQRFL